jgi:bacillopeptidase F (M6 metalloprotease family)
MPRKSYNTYQTVGRVVGWYFLGKTALNATLHGSDVSSERDSTRQPRHGCHASLLRSSAVRTLVRDVKTIQQRQVPLSGTRAKRISEKKP